MNMENRNNHKNQETVKTDKTVKTASAIFSESLKSLMPFFANNEKKGSRVKEGEAQTNLQLISFLSPTTVSTSSRKWAHIAAMVAMLLIIGVGDAWGTSNTAVYTVATTTSVTPSGVYPGGSSATFANTYSTKDQMIGGESQTLTLKSFGAVLITNITLSMHSNKSSGAGKLRYSTDGGSTWTYLVGSESTGVSFSNDSWHGSWSTSYVNVSKDIAIVTEDGKDLIIKIEATANSLFCQSYSITYTTDKFTVAYNRGSGTCGTPSQTQARTGEALTLPNAVPPVDCVDRGWEFAGWKKGSAQASTTSAPILLTGTYIPLSNETLYAVYKVTDGVTTTYNSNPNCTYDYYYDIMHGNEIEEIQGVYTVPAALSDATPGDEHCSEKHHHFIGWLEEEYINEDGSLKDGAMSHIVPAGETGHTAANKKYYAIWSKIE